MRITEELMISKKQSTTKNFKTTTCGYFMVFTCRFIPLAPSSRTDESFNICEFDDDPPPLGGLVRSVEMKTLLRKYSRILS